MGILYLFPPLRPMNAMSWARFSGMSYSLASSNTAGS